MSSVGTVQFSDRVRELQISEHLEKSRHSHVASALASLIVLIVFYNEVSRPWVLFVWLIVVNGMTFLRSLLRRYWRADDERIHRTKRWEARITVMAALSGLAWGAAGVGVLLLGNQNAGFLVALCVMGVAAGGVVSLSILWPAYLAFYLCMLLPCLVAFAAHMDYAFHWIAFIYLMFTLVMVFNGWRASYEIHHALIARLNLAEAMEQAQRARIHAEEANLAKSQFLSNMSHELRTPIHAILGFAQLGSERATDQKTKDYCKRISTSGNRLLLLINDLLDLSKLEAGRMDMHMQIHSVLNIVNAALHEMELLLREKDLQVEVMNDVDLASVPCDAMRIAQVVHNLLSNAIKFSPQGGKIQILLKSQEEESGLFRFVITDQGPGIPESELESVFDEFVQSSTTHTGAGGTGLGLAISRRIITAHRGRIYARNRLSGGAEFVIELPLAQPECTRLRQLSA